MKTTDVKKSIKEICENEASYLFNADIQRNEVWTEEAKSKLIHSLIVKYPVPHVLVRSVEGKNIVYDGKQRMTTIIRFRNNEFGLTDSMHDVIVTDSEGNEKTCELKGKIYSEMDKEIQQRIDEYALEFKVLEEVTEQELREIFQRYNNGVPLTKYELCRARNYGETFKEIERIAEHQFFKEQAKISNNSRNRMVDQQAVIQSIMMLEGVKSGFSNSEIDEYISKIKDPGIPDETIEKVNKAADYLSEAFKARQVSMDKPIPVKAPKQISKKTLGKMNDGERQKAEEEYKIERQKYDEYKTALENYSKEKKQADSTKYLKGINIPPIFMCATIAHGKATPEQFYNWVCTFFEATTGEIGSYRDACGKGTAKKEAVNKRKRAMYTSLRRFLVKSKLMTSDETSEFDIKYGIE